MTPAAELPWVYWTAAAALLTVEWFLATVLVSLNALNRVAVHRLAGEDPKLEILIELKSWPSVPRMVCHVLRQGSLLSASWLIGMSLSRIGWTQGWLAGALIALVVGVLGVEVIGARAIALRDPRRALRLAATPLRWIVLPLRPLAAPLSRLLARTVVDDNGNEDEAEDEQDEQVEALIEAGEREGILEADEGQMMRSIVDLDDTLVREIMTPRTDIVSVPVDYRVAQARQAVLDAAHSRLPVFQGQSDNVVGVLHARDLIRAWEHDEQDERIADYLRPALFVPETLTVAEALAQMRLKSKIAMVIDEYGGIAGLVTLEDVLEEIVGDIRDEHDMEEAAFHAGGDGSWIVTGSASIKEFEDLLDVEVAEREFDTVAGLVVAAFGRVPREGEQLDLLGLRFEVIQADDRRVYRLRVRRDQDERTDDESGAA